MSSSGGFFVQTPWASASSSRATGSGSGGAARATRQAGEEVDVIVPKKLSSKQESRLMSYVDDKFNEISRGYAKRYEPSSPLQTLPAYLKAISSLLSVITSIPPWGTSASLLVSYLLRATSDITESIPGYSLALGEAKDVEDGSVTEDERQQRHFQIKQLELASALMVLEVLDRAWNAILCGEQPIFENAKQSAEEDVETRVLKTHKHASGKRVDAADGNEGDSTEVQTSRRYLNTERPDPASSASTKARRDSQPIFGSKGIRTVGQTDRVRLRNIIVLGKEGLFSWMRSSLDAPLPPRLVDEVTGAVMPAPEEGNTGGNSRGPAWKEMKELLVEQGNLNTDWSARHAEANAEEGADEESANDAAIAQQPEQIEDGGDEEEEEEEEEEEMAEVVLDKNVQVNGGEELGAQDYGVGHDQAEAADGAARGENGFAAQETAHYQELFDRKLDPDASDDDDDQPAPTPEESGGKRSRDDAEATVDEEPATKRQETDDDDDDTAADEQGDAASKHKRQPLPEWDLAFSQLFRRSLKTLSEIGEEIGKVEGQERRGRQEPENET